VRHATLQEAVFANRTFDVVTMVDVFEHVGEPLEILREVRRVLRDDGLLFVKVPNGRYNLFKHWLFRRVLGLRGVEIFDAKEHVVHYTAKSIKDALAAGGFRVRTMFVPLPIQDGAWWKCALRSTAHRLARIQRRIEGGFGPLATDIAVVAEKAPDDATLRSESRARKLARSGHHPGRRS
jgi:SAM-dependent methyltransferase